MAKKFSELRAKMSPEAQERSRMKADIILAQLKLADLRKAEGLTQEQVSATLGVSQVTVSGYESGRNISISTLDKYVRAIGGELELGVKLPNKKKVSLMRPGV